LAQAEADNVLKSPMPEFQGLCAIRDIVDEHNIDDINLVKPGIGETTRVLLRRVPWKILVDRMDNPHLAHVLLLAKERKVPVEERQGLPYSCCGLIKPQRLNSKESK
jgi:hypothetical protein